MVETGGGDPSDYGGDAADNSPGGFSGYGDSHENNGREDSDARWARALVRFRYRTVVGGPWSEWREAFTGEDGHLTVDLSDRGEVLFVEMETEIVDEFTPGYADYVGYWIPEMEVFEEGPYIDPQQIRTEVLTHRVHTTDQQYMNLQAAWCTGPVGGIEELKVNDQTLNYYNDLEDPGTIAVTHEFAPGWPAQGKMPGFETHTENCSPERFPMDLSSPAEGDPQPWGWATCPEESGDLTLGFKTQIYDHDRSSSPDPNSVTFHIHAMPVTVGPPGGAITTDPETPAHWTAHADYSRVLVLHGAGTDTQYKSIRIVAVPEGAHHIRVQRITQEHIYFADVHWQYMTARSKHGFSYPGLALTGIRALATRRLSASADIRLSAVLKGQLMEVPKLVDGTGNTVPYAQCYWDPYDKRYRHPGQPDAAITETSELAPFQWSANPFWIYHFLLTDPLYGLGDRIPKERVDLAELREGARWADTIIPLNYQSIKTYTVGTSGAWYNRILYAPDRVVITDSTGAKNAGWRKNAGKDLWVEILEGEEGERQIRRVTGNDTHGTVIVSPPWSKVPAPDTPCRIFPAHKRFELHGIVRKPTRVVDLFTKVLACARSMPAVFGARHTAVRDRKRPAQHLLTMSNIIKGSFKEAITFSLPTHVRGTFTDRGNDWAVATREREADDFNPGDPRMESVSELWGTVDGYRAAARLEYLFRRAYRCPRTCTGEVMLDALTFIPGERVLIQHDHAGWALGGRLREAEPHGVMLDRTVHLSPDDDCVLVLRVTGDTEGPRSFPVDAAATCSEGVLEGPEIYACKRIRLQSPLETVPAPRETPWILEDLGRGYTAKSFLIRDIRRKNNNSAKVTFQEYDPAIYTDVPAAPMALVTRFTAQLPKRPEAIEIRTRPQFDGARWKPMVTLTLPPPETGRTDRFLLRYRVDEGPPVPDAPDPEEVPAEAPVLTEEHVATGLSMAFDHLSGKTFSFRAAYLTPDGIRSPLSKLHTAWVAPLDRVKPVRLKMVDATDFHHEPDPAGGAGTYAVKLSWDAYGWETYTDGGRERHRPIRRYNGGDNIHNVSHFVLAYDFVGAHGEFPADPTTLRRHSLADHHLPATDPDGRPVTDPDRLDALFRHNHSFVNRGVPYLPDTIVWTIIAVHPDGYEILDPDAPPHYGLDWGWYRMNRPLTAPVGTMNVRNVSYTHQADTAGGPGTYSALLRWDPIGWQPNPATGLWQPITEWNDGYNVHNISHFVLAWDFVDGDGKHPPTLDGLHRLSLRDHHRSIRRADGSPIADPAQLDAICRHNHEYLNQGVPYLKEHIFWTIIPVNAAGEEMIDPDRPTDWGLDWEWQHMPNPAAHDGHSIETAQITEAITYWRHDGAGRITQRNVWRYPSYTPSINDGFVDFWCEDAHFWSWPLTAPVAADRTAPPPLDITAPALAAANAAWERAKTRWREAGITHCLFLFTDDESFEIVRRHIDFGVMERGAEGTPPKAWPAGTRYAYLASDLSGDKRTFHRDPTRRSTITWPTVPGVAVNTSMAAYRDLGGGRYVRGPVTPFTFIEEA